jgi:hypothetical protein
MPLMRTTVAVHAHAVLVTYDQQPLAVHDDTAHFSDPQLGFRQRDVNQADHP